MRSDAIDALMRCPDCDLLQQRTALLAGQSARCPRCGSVLYREIHNSVDHALGLTLAALFLWLVANAYPFMTFEFKGQSQSNYLLSGVLELWNSGAHPLAALICFTSILAPIVHILGTLYVLAPLRFGHRPPGLVPIFRWLDGIQPWGMLEVYLLGVMVAVFKLNALASIEPGIAMWAFGVLILVWTASRAALDPRQVWAAVEWRS